MITKNKLSNILYRVDPMNTSCTSNKGMENEYDKEANEIVDLLCLGVPLKHAYFSVMSHWFWVEHALKSKDIFTQIQLECEILSLHD